MTLLADATSVLRRFASHARCCYWLRPLLPGFQRVCDGKGHLCRCLLTVLDSYDRYWMGRSAWGDLLRHCRTLSRLTWYHVPLRVSPTDEPTDNDKRQIQREKRMVVKMIEALAGALPVWI